MDDNLIQLCASPFEDTVEELFEAYAELPGPFAHIPYIGGLYQVRDQLAIPGRIREVCRALAAQRWHQYGAPAWGQPLPLRSAECEALICDESPKLNLVGYFGQSLRWQEFRFWEHPSFRDYARGVMACEHTPDALRDDRELLMLFPLRGLAGLDSHLAWNTPEQIAAGRAMEARQRQECLDMGWSLAEVRAEFGY